MAMDRFLLLLGFAALTGCGTTVRYVAFNPAPRALSPRDPQAVQVFAAARPSQPFVEVGLIEVQQASQYSLDDATVVLEKMRLEAAARGCDGLVLLGSNDATFLTGTGGAASQTWSHTLRGYRGSCIAFTGPPADASAPAGSAPAPAPSAPPRPAT